MEAKNEEFFSVALFKMKIRKIKIIMEGRSSKILSLG